MMIYQVEITLKKYKKIQSNLTGETIEFSHNNMEPFLVVLRNKIWI